MARKEPVEQGQGAIKRGVSRAWLLLVAAIAAGLGYWGLLDYRPRGTPPSDLLYLDLQLFGLNFDALPGVTLPWMLQVARFLAPAVTFVAAFLAIVGASSLLRRFARWQIVLVVGDTAEAAAVASEVRRRSGRGLLKRAAGFGRVVQTPEGDLESLRAAGLRRARVVYALSDDREDAAANVAAALAAVSVPQTRVYAHVSDPELAIGLRARRLMTGPGRRVEFFSMDDLAARAHVEQETFDESTRPEILVAGAGAFGRAVIVAFAQHWRRASGRPDERIAVTLVGEDATPAKQQLLDRWAVVAETCDIAAIDAKDLASALHANDIAHPYRAYICYEDEHFALRAALDAVPLWHGDARSLVVRLSRLSRHAHAFREERLLDHLGGRLVVADVAALAAPYVAANRDIFEDLARLAHQQYLEDAFTRGARIGDRPSLQPWRTLDPFYQEDNRSQARHIAQKLRAVGATIAPHSARNPAFALTDLEVEMLARMEHDRWLDVRCGAGWKYGPEEDWNRKRHPDVVKWDKLPETSRDKDRLFVRAIPSRFGRLLGEFGLQIARL